MFLITGAERSAEIEGSRVPQVGHGNSETIKMFLYKSQHHAEVPSLIVGTYFKIVKRTKVFKV